jgi:CP family cyanate transporter-like MFS transporter
LVASFSWQFALAFWALLAAVTVHLWQSAPRSSMVFTASALSPRRLFRSAVSWHLTVYFGLVSTLTFLVMGWLPGILRDAGVSPGVAGFCLALSMAMGLPMMWLVPLLVHKGGSQSLLVTLLALSNAVGVVGLLLVPAVMPWLWSVGLGTGMGGLAMALTTISVRANGNADVTTALSGMVQGLGYLIAGVGALACGLVHSITGGWQAPLAMALVVLCGQVWCGTRAARPIVVRPVDDALPVPSQPLPLPRVPAMSVPEEVLPEIPLPRTPILPVAQPERAAEPT